MRKTFISIRTIPETRIETDNLFFRHPVEQDIPKMLELTCDQMLIENSASDVTGQTAEYMQGMVRRIVDNPSPEIDILGFHLKGPRPDLIGVARYAPMTAGEYPSIGFWIRAPYRRLKYNLEIGAGLFDYAFVARELEALIAWCFEANTATPHLCRRFGFTPFGERMVYSVARGRKLPARVFRLTREVWVEEQRHRFIA